MRAKRQIVFVDDVSGDEASTINQAIVFPVKNADRKIIGVVVIARNMFSNIELYEELYEVRAAIITPDYDLSLESYDTVEEGVFGINNMEALIEAAKIELQSQVSRSIFTENLTELGASVTVLSLSDYLPGGRANLVVFQDQKEQFDALAASNLLVYSIVIALIVFITVGVIYITAKAFAGITSAIGVLQSLTNDELDAHKCLCEKVYWLQKRTRWGSLQDLWRVIAPPYSRTMPTRKSVTNGADNETKLFLKR